jgi:pSer/pThr/pTyr-binding forkhead associated (FHA) protein
MFCPNCGFKNSEGVNYCARCGTRLLVEDEGGQTTASYSLSDEDREAQPLRELIPEHPTLVIRSGGGRAGETYELVKQRTTIGRHPDSDIFLDDVTVSRNHAVVTQADHEYVLTDEGSLNGTYVNRRRTDRHVLLDGDDVQIGKYKFTFISP